MKNANKKKVKKNIHIVVDWKCLKPSNFVLEKVGICVKLLFAMINVWRCFFIVLVKFKYLIKADSATCNTVSQINFCFKLTSYFYVIFIAFTCVFFVLSLRQRSRGWKLALTFTLILKWEVYTQNHNFSKIDYLN